MSMCHQRDTGSNKQYLLSTSPSYKLRRFWRGQHLNVATTSEVTTAFPFSQASPLSLATVFMSPIDAEARITGWLSLYPPVWRRLTHLDAAVLRFGRTERQESERVRQRRERSSRPRFVADCVKHRARVGYLAGVLIPPSAPRSWYISPGDGPECYPPSDRHGFGGRRLALNSDLGGQFKERLFGPVKPRPVQTQVYNHPTR